MSQEYTPVDWVDETPTQPGTLINKERLDQMQSAHHYADGFEEVDAIPTADPGVDYHKVVYCTADSTFYRWDGTQWTADIDDDTKRLLLEHEADHANPHAVTKAQVGLGNVDNTSDADKPVSTATASAIGLVQGYLDAHEANHNNPHQVTKAQVGLGNADNTADLDKPVSTAQQAALDQKANDNAVVHLTGDEVLSNGVKANTTAGSSSASATKDVPPRFVVQSTGFDRTALQGINRHYPVAGLNDKNGKPVAKLNISTTDAAIYAYLQAIGTDEGQATLEIGKFDRTTKTWSPTMVNDALDSYATMVRTVNAQTIAGIKTFTDGIIAYPQGWHPCIPSGGLAQGKWSIFAKIPIGSSGAGCFHYIEFGQVSNTAVAHAVLAFKEANDPLPVWIERTSRGGNDPIINANDVVVLRDGTDLYLAWKRGVPYGGLNAREYLSTNYGAVRAYGTNIEWISPASMTVLDNLDAYSVYEPEDRNVRTLGAQTVAGVKTFTDNPEISKNTPLLNISIKNYTRGTAPGSSIFNGVRFIDSANANVGGFRLVNDSDGNRAMMEIYNNGGSNTSLAVFYKDGGTAYATAPARAYNASNTSDVVTIGLLDGYTPMVRTTGNQTIDGNKTFSNAMIGTISLMRNKNINNISVKVGLASGTGAYKYGSAFYIVVIRNTAYFVTMSSGSSALKHDTISVLNLSTGVTVNTSDLDWKMGYYIDADSQIFVTITGPSANRITWVHFMGGSQGGSSGLIMNPTSNDTVPTADVVTFW